MRPGPRVGTDRARLAAGVVFGLVTAGLLIGGVATLILDDGGTAAATFPPGDHHPAVISRLPEPLGLDTAWNATAFINDDLWTAGDAQYAVWAGPDGRPFTGRRQLPDGPWTAADLGAVPGNPLAVPTEPDAHNVYAIAVDAEGYVHVAGNMHADPLRYVRSSQPRSIDQWTTGAMVGSEEASVTYPAFVLAPDGALLFFYRDGSAGDGNTILNRLAPGTGAWERVATLIDGRSSGESAYLQHVAVDATGAIHLVFLWRAGEDPATNADVSYARSEDGGRTWLASDGSMLELPITHGAADVAVPTRPGSLQLVNQGGLTVDGSGRPHAVFRARSPAQGEGVLHVWRDDTAWRRELLLTDRSVDGRPALVAGAEGVGLLWAERTSRRSSTLWLTELVGGRATDEVLLARLPVDGWEPTFDSVALARRGKLHVLLPVERDGDGAAGGTGAVVTWDLASLASVLGGVTPRRSKDRRCRTGPGSSKPFIGAPRPVARRRAAHPRRSRFEAKSAQRSQRTPFAAQASTPPNRPKDAAPGVGSSSSPGHRRTPRPARHPARARETPASARSCPGDLRLGPRSSR